MNLTSRKLGSVSALGLAIACLAATAVALPASAQASQNSVNTNNTRIRQPRRTQANERVTQRESVTSGNRVAQSPEAVERQTLTQDALLRDLEWRRQYGDLDPTPAGTK